MVQDRAPIPNVRHLSYIFPISVIIIDVTKTLFQTSLLYKIRALLFVVSKAQKKDDTFFVSSFLLTYLFPTIVSRIIQSSAGSFV